MPRSITLDQLPSPSSRPVLSATDSTQAVGRPVRSPHGRRLIDSHGRTIRDLRLSITDRCNFRCVYCMEPDVRFAASDALLTADELLRVARATARLGVEHIRITGGEPTVRSDLLTIIKGVAAIPGVRDVAMTTNGSRADEPALRAWMTAGLRRITFSLDAIEPATVRRMTRARGDAGDTLAAIASAIRIGLEPVKVNAVVIRGMNESEVPKLAALARDMGLSMRFIEYMPLDSGRRWDPSLLVPATEIIERASEAGDLTPLGRPTPESTSEDFRFAPGVKAHPRASIGVIAPVTRPFCGACSRLRITADGAVRPCLFSLEERSLRALLRSGREDLDDALEDALLDAVWSKQAGHGITAAGFTQPDRPMSAIGG
jgi:GTP 3',8-cyclase